MTYKSLYEQVGELLRLDFLSGETTYAEVEKACGYMLGIPINAKQIETDIILPIIGKIAPLSPSVSKVYKTISKQWESSEVAATVNQIKNIT